MADRKDAAEAAEATHIEGTTNESSALNQNALKILWTNPTILFASLFANLGSFMYGFDNTILAMALPMVPFEKQFGTSYSTSAGTSYIIPAHWQSLWNALAQVATGLGSFLVALISDSYGRRMSFFVAGIISAAGIAVLYVSAHPAVFLVGKIINGVALGMAIAAGQTYVAEVSPMKCRGILLSIYIFSLYLGSLIGSIIANSRVNIESDAGYKVMFSIGFIWAGLLVLFAWVVPESPIHWIRKEKVDKARKAFQQLYTERADIASILDEAIQTNNEEQEMRSTTREVGYIDCFRGTNWRRTRIVLYCNGVNQLLGSTFAGNGPYFLVNAGMTSKNATLVSEIGGALNCVSMLVVFYLLTQFTRRSIILWGVSLCAVMFLPMGIAGCFPSSSAALWTIGILMQAVTVLGFAPSIGPAAAVAAEIPQLRLKSKSQSIGFLFNFLFSTIWNAFVPYLFNADEANLGGKMGFIFFATAVFSFAILWYELPETKDITYSQLDHLFHNRVPARQFRSAATEIEAFSNNKA